MNTISNYFSCFFNCNTIATPIGCFDDLSALTFAAESNHNIISDETDIIVHSIVDTGYLQQQTKQSERNREDK